MVNSNKKEDLSTKGIVIFDGYCKFCNGFIDYLINHDTRDYLRFVFNEDKLAHTILKKYGYENQANESVYYIKNFEKENEEFYVYSTAAINTLYDLGGVHKLAIVMKICPKFIRDRIYLFESKHRYKLWGKRKACRVPTEDIRHKFLLVD